MTESARPERLVLIDGHSLVYRAYFALPSLTDRDGRVVNAAYGFTSMLLVALQSHPDYVLASFDLGGRTFRHEELAQYKATRRPTPPELSPQFPLTRDIVRAFGGDKFSIRLSRVPTKTVGIPSLAFEVENLRFNTAARG